MTPEQFQKRIEGVRELHLSTGEKQDMMKAIMDTTPVPISVSYEKRNLFSYFAYSRYALAGLVMFVLSGVGVISAAEGAAPGDILYPVKVGITEPMRDVLAVSAEAKAEWESKKTERRLKEAETLALRGELDEPRRIALQAQFERHSDKFNSAVAAIPDASTSTMEKALRSKLVFDTVVTSRVKVFEELQERPEVPERDKKELKTLGTRIAMKLEEGRSASVSLDAGIDMTMSLATRVAPAAPEGSGAGMAEVTLRGAFECLPHKNRRGPVALECAFGLKAEDGLHYALDFSKLTLEDYAHIPTGQKLEVTGTIDSAEPANQKYDIAGTLRVSKVGKAE